MRVAWRDIVEGVRGVVLPCKSSAAFEEAFQALLGSRHVFGVSSGRAALCMILRAVGAGTSRNTVVIPAFICPTIPLAIARAGLRVKVCDTAPGCFDYDMDQLEQCVDAGTLCVLVVHLAGLPHDMARLQELCARSNTLIIEDCAQSMGAVCGEKQLGRFGVCALFSLWRGKGVTAFTGGLITTDDNALSGRIARQLTGPAAPGRAFGALAGSLAYMGAFLPRLHGMANRMSRFYWQARGLPLGAEGEYHTMDFPLGALTDFQKGVVCSGVRRLPQAIETQRRNARYYLERLGGVAGLRVAAEPDGTRATCPVAVIFFDDPDACAAVYAVLRARGLGASNLYTRAINEYEYLRPVVPAGGFPHAERTARVTLTLPTHARVTDSDRRAIVRIIKQTMARRA